MAPKRPVTPGRDAVAKAVKAIAGSGCDLWSVWRDWTEAAALALRNVADLVGREQREERYRAILAKYKPEQQRLFPEAYAALVEALEAGIDDVLGGVFMALELGNKWAGQFFTPFALCRLMAKMLFVDRDELKAQIDARGFVTVMDPAVGGGAMLLACVQEFLDAGLNPQTQLHVTAQDIDERSAWMTYVQLSTLGIPAAIVVGDTLRMECRDVWYTHTHITGLWSLKLRRGERVKPADPMLSSPAPQPPSAAAQLPLF